MEESPGAGVRGKETDCLQSKALALVTGEMALGFVVDGVDNVGVGCGVSCGVGDGDCLLFYILAASKVISGQVPTCDSVHSWQLYSAAQL